MSHYLTSGQILTTVKTLRGHQNLALHDARELLAKLNRDQSLLHRSCADTELHPQSEVERHLLLAIEALESSIMRLDHVIEVVSIVPQLPEAGVTASGS